MNEVKRYTKKPVVIEAIQLTPNTVDKCVAFCGGKIKAHPMVGVVVETLRGNMTADVGDFIIKGIKGEFYPCKPDIFEATYTEGEATDYGTLMLALKLICDAQVVSLGLKNGESLEEIETKIAKKSLEMQNAFIEQAKKESK